MLLGGLAVAYGFQMWPALIAVCWWPFLTRQGVTVGLVAGLIAVTLTESIGVQWFGVPWGRWPLTIHSAGWGMLFNLGLAILVSAFTQDREALVEDLLPNPLDTNVQAAHRLALAVQPLAGQQFSAEVFFHGRQVAHLPLSRRQLGDRFFVHFVRRVDAIAVALQLALQGDAGGVVHISGLLQLLSHHDQAALHFPDHGCQLHPPQPLLPLDDVFMAPHSRENGLLDEDIAKHEELTVVADSEPGGAYIILGNGGKQVYVTGHSEYDPDCLRKEYERDVGKGLDIHVPENYFPGDDPPVNRWCSGEATRTFSSPTG